MAARTLTFASLFTGGGLADVGAKQAGYKLLWGIELDPDIAAVAQANLGHPVHAASVISFDWASLPKPDHLHMSPPCQDFSVAKTTGKVANANDELAAACIEAITALQPNTVTLENVEGYRKAAGFQAIVDTLFGLGYWVDWAVLNAADFGVPQTRRRLILRAVHGGFLMPLPPPEPWVGWYQAIDDLIPTLPESKFAEWQLKRLPEELKSHLCHGTERSSPDYDCPKRRDVESPCWTVKASAHKGLPKALLVHRNDQQSMPTRTGDEPAFTVLAGGNATHAPSVLHRAYLVESKNANQAYGDGLREAAEPHTTVITDHKPSHQPKVLLVDGKGNNRGTTVTSIEAEMPKDGISASAGKHRVVASTPQGRVVRMTPRALARMQSVPDWYVLPGKVALACKIIGNGVPCLMMQRIMESFS